MTEGSHIALVAERRVAVLAFGLDGEFVAETMIADVTLASGRL
jgi:hypothetical protein